jgi:hypothetical protein
MLGESAAVLQNRRQERLGRRIRHVSESVSHQIALVCDAVVFQAGQNTRPEQFDYL